MKLRLSQKGLIILAIPLALQLGFFAYQNQLLNVTESIAREEYQSKTIIGKTHWLTVLILGATLGSITYAATGQTNTLHLVEKARHDIPKELSDLQNIVKADSQQVERVLDAQNDLASLLDKLYECISSRESGGQASALREITEVTTLPIWTSLFKIRHDILAAENARYNLKDELLPGVRGRQRLIIQAGLALNVIATITIFLLFTQSITNRLAVMRDNTARFARRETLHAPLAIKDEVGELDRDFHEMANALVEADRKKQEFLQVISHDIRTPLTAIGGILSILSSEQFNLPKEALQLLDRANHNADSLLNLIRDLLEIEKADAGKTALDLRIFDIRELMNQTADSLLSLAEKDSITIDYPERELLIYADEFRLKRVLTNLLGNAIKFSPPGGKITLDANKIDNSIEVTVKDEGPGIAPENIDKVFERFQQVSADDSTKRGGTGLGLAICKSIISSHGGEIGVRSEPHGGSEFWFRIPLPNSNED